MISHLGTFDVENYGDLLYPLVFRRLLQRRDASLRVRQYSLLPGDAPQEAGFETYPARSLFEAGRAEPRRLVVGGGDILRTDWDLVAKHYVRNSRVSYGGLRRSIGTVGLFCYFLRKNLPRLEASSFYAGSFRALDGLPRSRAFSHQPRRPASGRRGLLCFVRRAARLRTLRKRQGQANFRPGAIRLFARRTICRETTARRRAP